MPKAADILKAFIVPLVGALLVGIAAAVSSNSVGPPALDSFIVLVVREADMMWNNRVPPMPPATGGGPTNPPKDQNATGSTAP